jgi:hypothetical protein
VELSSRKKKKILSLPLNLYCRCEIMTTCRSTLIKNVVFFLICCASVMSPKKVRFNSRMQSDACFRERERANVLLDDSWHNKWIFYFSKE